MDLTELEVLTETVLLHIALNLPFLNIIDLCSTSSILNKRICQNEIFWKSKFLQDFGEPVFEFTTWKDAYLMNTSVWGLGRPTHVLESLAYSKYVSAGEDHFLSVLSNGTVIGFGENKFGKLGFDKYMKEIRYLPIPNLKSIVQTACGKSHSLALDNNGKIWVFGSNQDGQIGLESKNYVDHAVQLERLPPIQQVSAGENHSLLLTKSGSVYSMGNNEAGQLGVYLKDETVPGSMYKQKSTKPVGINVKNIIQIAAGKYHSLVLTETGEVYAFGGNNYGQLGIGNNNNSHIPIKLNLPEIKYIAAGGTHSLVIDIDGQVWSFGHNESGQLALNNYDNQNVPQRVPYLNEIISADGGYNHSLFLDRWGQVWSCGNDVYNQLGYYSDSYVNNIPEKIPNLDEIVQISTFANKSLVLGRNIRKRVDYKFISDLFKSKYVFSHKILPLDKENVDIEVYGIDGNRYIATVSYDKETDQFGPPIY